MTSKVSSHAAWGLGFFFALATLTGYLCLDHVLPSGPMTGEDFFILALCVLGATPLCYCFFSGLYRCLEWFAAGQVSTNFSMKQKVLTWLFAFMVIFICWVPVWLAYYPGLWNYDPPWQVWQYVNGDYNKHHPLIHTLLLGACYAFGEPNSGVILYDFIQMFIMASIFAYAYVYITERISSRLFRFFVLLFFAVFPVNSIMAISSTKDVLFSGFVLLCLVISARLLEKKARGEGENPVVLLILLFCVTLMLLFRNTGIYAFYLLTILAILLILRGRLRKNILPFLLCCLVVFHAADIGLTKLLSAKPSPIQEMLSVPSQQIARVFIETKDEDSLKLLQSFYMRGARYNPHKADEMKNQLKPLKGTEVLSLLEGSLALFRKHPFISLISWLYLTEGSWYINDTSFACIYGTGLKNRQGYLQTCVMDGFNIVHESKLPNLESWLERAFSANEYQNWPLISLLFAPALYFWILLFCSIGFYSAGRWNYLFLSGFLWALFLTILAGPCALVRYSYPLIVCAPVLLCMLVRGLKTPCSESEPITIEETQKS